MAGKMMKQPQLIGVIGLALTMMLAAACNHEQSNEDGAGQVELVDDAPDDVAGAAGSAEDVARALDALEESSVVSVEDIPLIRIGVPTVPPVVLPDLSVLGATGDLFGTRIGGLSDTEGLDVLAASCAADGGGLVYQGNESSGFLQLGSDNAARYRDRTGLNEVDFTLLPDGSASLRDRTGATELDIEVGADGSGRLRDRSGSTELDIVVLADGTGTYRDRTDGAEVNIDVHGEGTGMFRDRTGEIELNVDINGDGSAMYRDRSGAAEVDIAVAPDGTGSYRDRTGGVIEVNLSTYPDGSWEYRDRTGEIERDLRVFADGSGSYRDRTGAVEVDIRVQPDGSGTYRDRTHDNVIDVTFTTDIGILDPDLLVAGPKPVFGVADRFPPLDTLGRLSPPCVAIIRLGADVLFDFDSDQLRPEAAPVVDEVAAALIETGAPLEIHGHTDSLGDDAYNDDLAARRAEAFEAALVERGVTAEIETKSFGETMPVAPNEHADGSDNPAGRQLNRRIEIVIPE